MKSFNLIYKSKVALENFIISNSFSKEKNILVQIFSSIIDENILLDVSGFIKKQVPHAKIIGATTAGEIIDAKMYEEKIVLSFLIFESTVIKSSLYDFNDTFDINKVAKELICENTKALIVFSDGLKSNAENLIQELGSIKTDLIIAGGGKSGRPE